MEALAHALPWFGFWIFLSVAVVWDCKVFMSGRDSYFQSHKTPQEKALQQAVIEKAKS